MGTTPKLSGSKAAKGVAAGVKAANPTNAASLGRILGMARGKTKAADSARRVDVMLGMATGSDESRAALKKVWDGLDGTQKEALVKELVAASPHPVHRTGINPETGKAAYSDDVKRVFEVFRSGTLKNADTLNDANAGVVRVETQDGGKPGKGVRVKSHEPAVEDMDPINTRATSADAPEGAMAMEAPGELDEPSGLARPPLPKGLDPKARGIKDPNSGSGKNQSRSSIETRTALDAGDATVDMVETPNGKVPVRSVDQGTGRRDVESFTRMKHGEAYEAAVEANIKFQRETLLGLFGSDKGIAEAIAKANDGDEAILKQFEMVREMANKEAPVPKKPYPSSNDLAGTKSPQDAFDQYVQDLAFGNPTSAVYTPKRSGHPTTEAAALKGGDNDSLMNAWKLLQDGGKASKLPPQQVFTSAREMAEVLVRNANQSMFDTMPVTANQRSMAQIGLSVNKNSDKFAKQVAKEYSPDAPYTQADRAVTRDQAIERLTKQIESRLGTQWGEDYKPGATRIVETADDYRPARLDKEDLELYPAPESRMPSEPVSTTQDPANVPMEGGVPNKAGKHELGSFEERMARYEQDSERLLRETRNKTASQAYQDSDRYVKTPVRPRSDQDFSRSVDQDSIDGETAGQLAGEDTFTKDEVLKNWDGKLPEPRKADEAVEVDEPEVGPRPMTSRDSADDWHKETYRNYKDGKPTKSSSYEDEFAAYNARNRNLTPDEVTRREALAAERSRFFPDSLTNERTSDLLRQIDEVNERLGEVPPEISKIYDQLEAEGITPSQATALRDQLKELNAQHVRSKADDYSLLDDLKERLAKARHTDALTGIQSARTPPLGGRVGKNKGKAAETTSNINLGEDDAPAISNRPGTEQPTVNPAPAKAEPEHPVISGKADAEQVVSVFTGNGSQKQLQAAIEQMRQLESRGKALSGTDAELWEAEVVAPMRSALEERVRRSAAPPKTPKAKPEKAPPAEPPVDPGTGLVATGPGNAADGMPNFRRSAEDAVDADPVDPGTGMAAVGRSSPADDADAGRPIDAVESSSTPLDEDIIDAEFEVKDGPDAAAKAAPEAEAAAKADAEKAPEDAEAKRLTEESETIPKDAGSPETKTDVPADGAVKPAPRTWLGSLGGAAKDVVTYPFRHPYKTALGLGALALHQMAANDTSTDPSVGNGWPGGADGRPTMGQAPSSGDGMGVGAAQYDGPLSPEDRIRLLRSQHYIPQGTPQTFFQWR
jgi:hypothetical protein